MLIWFPCFASTYHCKQKWVWLLLSCIGANLLRSVENEPLLAVNFIHESTVLQKFQLIDTAGIRRRAVVASSGSTTEALSVNRAFRAIRRSDVVALVIEAMACITEQVVYPLGFCRVIIVIILNSDEYTCTLIMIKLFHFPILNV